MSCEEVEYLGTKAGRLAPIHGPRPLSGIMLRIETPGEPDSQSVLLRKSDANIVVVGRRPGGPGLKPAETSPGRLSFSCPVVSREHARFTYSDSGTVYLVDLASHHGTLKNGVKLAPNIPTLLADKDVLTFGKSVGAESGLVRPIVATVSFVHQAQAPVQPFLAPRFHAVCGRRYGLSEDSDSDSDSSHDSDVEEVSQPPPLWQKRKDDTNDATADFSFFSSNVWIPEDFQDEIEDDDQLDDEDSEHDSAYSRYGSSMDLSSSPEPPELSPQPVVPVLSGGWPRSRSSSPPMFSSSFPSIRIAPMPLPKPVPEPIVDEPGSPKMPFDDESDQEEEDIFVMEDKDAEIKVDATAQFKESVDSLKGSVEKLEAQRRKYKERFNDNIKLMNEKFTNLEDKSAEASNLYQRLSDKMAENLQACQQAQAQLDVLQLDMFQQRLMDGADKGTEPDKLEEERQENAKKLQDLVSEMTELRDNVRNEVNDELQTVRAAKDALKALTEQMLVETESLKRKRSVMEDSEEEQPTPVVPMVTVELERPRKRARLVTKLLGRTVTATAVGAVVCWSAMAFS